MRLIDADALDMYECLRSYYGDAWRDAQKAIDDAPTVDAVEVVRCKDCRFRYQDGAIFCLLGTQSDEWFCANGERREDGKR